MLKRIPVEQLRTGMYLQELCGSWLDHPFWRSSFLLSDPQDITKLRDSSVREVLIDTAKGDDVDFEEAEEQPTPDGDDDVHEPVLIVSHATQVERVGMNEELKRAARICAKSKAAVVSMFREARMGKAIEAEQCAPLVEEISTSIMRNPGALISLARLKTADDYTYMHSVAVCALMIALARQLGLDEAQTREAGLAGLLHDVGKMAVEPEILNKPGKLTDQEFVAVKRHPEEGYRILAESRGVGEIALDVCLHHHEKMDGTGYPHRLPGDEISLFSRMGAVCDVYDAITSNRPYKAGWDPAESLRKMTEWSNGHFDPVVFQAFVKSVGIYPVGSLVRLKSGRLGIVVDQTGKSLLTPKVKVFFSTRSNARIPPELLDLSSRMANDKIVAREDPERWKFADLNELWGGVELWN
jgi:putative nucleotidyltransferase with HDIG domain